MWPPPPDAPRILLLDDDEGCRRAVARVLAIEGLRAVPVASLAEARTVLSDSPPPAAVVVELRLPDGEGVEALEEARRVAPFTGRVMLTGVVDFQAVQDAVNRGAVQAFFTKPWDNESLVRGVRGVLEQCRLARDNAEMAERLADQNRALEALVRERTAALERAKRDLQAVFDAWEDPLALVAPDLHVLRANRAWAAQASLDVREVPGQVCHEALFGRSSPCDGCPVSEAVQSGAPIEAALGPTPWRVQARPLDLGHRAVLCRYLRARGP